MNELELWSNAVRESLDKNEFIKLSLSKPVKNTDLNNLYVKAVFIKNVAQLSFTYHYKTKDIVKNFGYEEGVALIAGMLGSEFKIGTLLTMHENISLHISKKGKMGIIKTKPSLTDTPSREHDKSKLKRASGQENYLHHLGVTDSQGKVIPKMADKFRQINKYLEVMESLIVKTELPDNITIVDMGAGKGYLTFALYHFLKTKLNKKVTITGVELRKELVDQGNAIAIQCGFDGLTFVESAIDDFNPGHMDILIALHACDTATDDSIAKGIAAKASLIICAPCCHKQIRQQVKGKVQKSPILDYGIFKEREFEMVTDTLRALIMEQHGYKPGIFEFISNEHTRKNIMLVGSKMNQPSNYQEVQDKIDAVKSGYQIEYHYLEKLV